MQDLVGHAEGFGEGGPLVGDAEQVLVGNDDQRVDIALQFGDAGVGQPHAVTPLEVEGLGDDADGQDAPLTGALGDDRRSPGAGAAAHARRDEDHVGAVEVLADLGNGFLGGAHADFRMGAGSETLRHLNPELDASVGLGEGKLLSICVGDDELDTLQPSFDHVVDGVTACPTDAEYNDARLQLGRARRGKCNSHWDLYVLRQSCWETRRPARQAPSTDGVKETPTIVNWRLTA